jgi:hypothetical protein
MRKYPLNKEFLEVTIFTGDNEAVLWEAIAMHRDIRASTYHLIGVEYSYVLEDNTYEIIVIEDHW